MKRLLKVIDGDSLDNAERGLLERARITYAREEMESEYKDGEQFIRATLKSALRSEEKRERARKRFHIRVCALAR